MEDTIPPPPMCFSCGNNLPESDFDLFHKLVRESVYEGMEEDASQKIILDGMSSRKLSKTYMRNCCRIMFIGDAYEYRKAMGRYEKLYPTNM